LLAQAAQVTRAFHRQAAALRQVHAFIVERVQEIDAKGGNRLRRRVLEQGQYLVACEGARYPDAAQRLGLVFTAQPAQGARHDVSIEAVAAVQYPQRAAACQPSAEG
jgi:hypothetical protein